MVRSIFRLFFCVSLLALVSSCSEQTAKDSNAEKRKNKVMVSEKLRATVQAKYMTTVLKASGEVTPVRQLEIFSRTRGVVTEVLAREGDEVNEGDLLITFDDRFEQKEFEERQAAGKKAARKLVRAKDALKRKKISAADYQELAANYKSSLEEFKALKQVLAAKRVTAPFSGVISFNTVQAGKLYNENEKLFTLTALSPVEIDFNLPVHTIGQVIVGQRVKIRSVSYPDREFVGYIKVIDTKVDRDKNVIRLKAACENSDQLLLQGMKVNISVVTGESRKCLFIPKSARLKGIDGYSVFKLEPKGDPDNGKQSYTAVKVPVEFGRIHENEIEVVSGVKEDDIIMRDAKMDFSGRTIICNVPKKVVTAEKKEAAVPAGKNAPALKTGKKATGGKTEPVQESEPQPILKKNEPQPILKKSEPQPILKSSIIE